MSAHVCALSSMAMIIYVLIEFNFLFYPASGKTFQQSLIPHHKFCISDHSALVS